MFMERFSKKWLPLSDRNVFHVFLHQQPPTQQSLKELGLSPEQVPKDHPSGINSTLQGKYQIFHLKRGAPIPESHPLIEFIDLVRQKVMRRIFKATQ